jgi:hypothetical protein
MSDVLLSHEHHSSLLSEPLRIQKILSLTQAQFFLGIGERHESSPCLKDAVDCLWAYVQQFIFSEVSISNRNKPVKYYIRALNSIRIALKDSNSFNGIDIWYATLILILYEVRLSGPI